MDVPDDWNPSVTTDMKTLQAEIAQAYREGAEAMREECFRAVAGKNMVLPSPIGPLHNIGWNQSNACALETIKALPVPVKP